MEDNLNYTKKAVDFYELGISTLDHMDGLNYKDFGKLIVGTFVLMSFNVCIVLL